MLVALATSAGCDAGPRDDQETRGPAITILGANVGIDTPLPADGAIEVAVDRYLLPSSVTRQSFVLVTGDNENIPEAQAPVVTYDPIARTVTLRGQRRPWLDEGKLYKLVVTTPGESPTSGLRAIDGATLAPRQKRRFEFFVGPPSGKPYVEPRPDLCRDVLPILANKCGGGFCHGDSPSAAQGLVLTTPKGLGTTAIGRVAHESDTTGRSGDPESEGRVFGVAMPLVQPGSPANSWLLYKVDAAPPPSRAEAPSFSCPSPPGVTTPAPALPYAPQLPVPRAADEIERGILRDLLGSREMPYPAPGPEEYATAPLTFEEREILRLWIAQLAPGAALPACGACTSR